MNLNGGNNKKGKKNNRISSKAARMDMLISTGIKALLFLKKKRFTGEDQLLFVLKSCIMSVTPSRWYCMSL
jgi:hypothetical protein